VAMQSLSESTQKMNVSGADPGGKEPAELQHDTGLSSFGGEASMSSELPSKSANLTYISDKFCTQKNIPLTLPQEKSFCIYQNILT